MKMEKIFNKLVRDNIPSIIESNNEIAVTKILNDEEYKKELLRKLSEECNEVINSKDNEEVLEELADLLEVMQALIKLENKSLEDVIDIALKKKNKRGGFENKIFLEKTMTKDE